MNKRILILITDVGLHLEEGRPQNNTVEEACGCYIALEQQGYEPVLLVDKNTTSPGRYRTVKAEDVDLSGFGEIMLNREVPNFYGGDVNDHHLFTVRTLCKFGGKISYFFCDPEMAKGSYLKLVYHKLFEDTGKRTHKNQVLDEKLASQLIDKSWLQDNLWKTEKDNLTVRTAYPVDIGHPIHKRFSVIDFIDSWRAHLFYVREPWNPIFDDPHESLLKSACYVGNHKPTRHKRLIELGLFTPQAEDEGWVKYYGKAGRPIREARGETPQRFGGQAGRINLEDVNQVYARHYASLVIGAPHQKNTGINHRFLQGLLVPRSMLVDAQQDEIAAFCVDKDLRERIYFKTADEYKMKLIWLRDSHFFDLTVQKLQAEFERIKSESREDFMKRVRGS